MLVSGHPGKLAGRLPDSVPGQNTPIPDQPFVYGHSEVTRAAEVPAHGPWSLMLVPGPWSLVPGPGPWSLVLVPGPWSLVPGPWSLVLGPWSLVPGPWSLVLRARIS